MRYARDPKWLNARRRDVCRKCHAEIKVGERIFYYPATRAVYCDSEACGKSESRSFECAAQDEANYCGTY